MENKEIFYHETEKKKNTFPTEYNSRVFSKLFCSVGKVIRVASILR